MNWDRLEFTTVGADLDASLAARLSDPVWMLARQWQIGELDGEDAAHPLIVHVSLESVAVTDAGARGALTPIQGRPIEALLEAEPVRSGVGAWRLALYDGLHLLRILDARGWGSLRAPLQQLFATRTPESADLDDPAWATVEILARSAIDARRVKAWIDRAPDLGPLLAAAQLAADLEPRLRQVLQAWSKLVASAYTEPASGASTWFTNRLHYEVELACQRGGQLLAADHKGGTVHWYDFDLSRAPTSASTHRDVTVLATPGRFRGMPDARWWTIEDESVRLQDLEGGPDEVAASLVTAFATVHSDDWLVVPIRAETGTLVRVRKMFIEDTFGDRHPIPHVATIDGETRVWKMFEHTPVPSTEKSNTEPWLLVLGDPPPEQSTPVEEVVFLRDEGANMAWAIERRIEAVTGGARVRGTAPVTAPRAHNPPWTLALRSRVGDGWIPLIPHRIEGEQMNFERGQLSTWKDLSDGALGVILQPGVPLTIEESAIPPGGLQVDRRVLRARGTDNLTHLWIGRRVVPGATESGSGMVFDRLEGPSRTGITPASDPNIELTVEEE